MEEILFRLDELIEELTLAPTHCRETGEVKFNPMAFNIIVYALHQLAVDLEKEILR